VTATATAPAADGVARTRVKNRQAAVSVKRTVVQLANEQVLLDDEHRCEAGPRCTVDVPDGHIDGACRRCGRGITVAARCVTLVCAGFTVSSGSRRPDPALRATSAARAVSASCPPTLSGSACRLSERVRFP
jgi:hypothetical protein